MSKQYEDAKLNLYRYLQKCEEQVKQRELKKIEDISDEDGLTGGDLLLYRIKKILSRLGTVK